MLTKSGQEAPPLSVAGQENLCRLSNIGKACLDGQVYALRGKKGRENENRRSKGARGYHTEYYDGDVD